MARCGCGSSSGGALANGTNTIVTGDGSPGNPYRVAAHTDCAEARACLTGTSGVNFVTGTGVISAKISATPGNALSVVGDGLLVSPSISTITTGAGLLGTGSVGNPARANVSAWNFPNTADTDGSLIYVDSTGKLRGEPGYHSLVFQNTVTRNYASVAVPAAALVDVDTAFTISVTNTDPDRTMNLVSYREFDFRINLPTTATACAGMDGVETWRLTNTGSTTMTGVHAMATRVVVGATLAPGATTNVSMQSQLGSGTASAVYTQIIMSHRVVLTPV
jgi:hypothetical protein